MKSGKVVPRGREEERWSEETRTSEEERGNKRVRKGRKFLTDILTQKKKSSDVPNGATWWSGVGLKITKHDLTILNSLKIFSFDLNETLRPSDRFLQIKHFI